MCVALLNRSGYMIVIYFLYIIKMQKSEGVHEIKKKNLNRDLLEENSTPNVNIFFKSFFLMF